MERQEQENEYSFDDVFEDELAEVSRRRQCTSSSQAHAADEDPRQNLAGLALSGGGIRSATFCLGLLQCLYEYDLLRKFDYLSTVSGGGYIGGWWSAWLSRKDRSQGEIFPDAERMELTRSSEAYLKKQTAESSVNAEKDPIHHLRLFANYLTPRKGLLSFDTWRAAAFITRNISLTWLVLLPILIIFMLLGQLFFVFHPVASESFPHPMAASTPSPTPNAEAVRSTLAPDQPTGTGTADISVFETLVHAPSDRATFQTRFNAAILPLLILLSLIIFCTGLWIAGHQSGPWLLTVLNFNIALLVIAILLYILFPSLFWPAFDFLPLILVLFQIVPLAPRIYYWIRRRIGGRKDVADARWRKEIQRNQFTRLHARLLFILMLGIIILGVAGFGHEFIDYVLYAPGLQEQAPLIVFSRRAAKYVSLSTLLGTVIGLIFTLKKTVPAGGRDEREGDQTTAIGRLIIFLTPPLVLAVLVFVAAWIAHALLWHTVTSNTANSIAWLIATTCLGVLLGLLLAVSEMEWARADSLQDWFRRRGQHESSLYVLLAVALAGGFIAAYQLTPVPQYTPLDHAGVLGLTVLPAVLAAVHMAAIRVKSLEPFKSQEGVKRRVLFLTVIVLCFFAATALVYWVTKISYVYFLAQPLDLVRQSVEAAGQHPASGMSLGFFFASAGIACCGIFYLFMVGDLFVSARQHRVSFRLVTVLYVMLLALLVSSFFPLSGKIPHWLTLARASIGLITALLAWVAAFGWLVDPNALSIHSFYKSRLVRAYLGASNKRRSDSATEITESVEEDDVLLAELQNTGRGAPYHLINTTLNLVGGRDLATAQRSSASFLLSRKYCGSLRTGYRATKDYMKGQLSLGTAVAVSGAAVSPNMGAIKVSTPLTMLMTLFNVRLGYWAPTPNQSRWRSPQARLWPYYVLREFLSETNDLSSYCYLTDGGHFDNTGLYSLVERGCKFIVVADCGADPVPCFSDLGDAIRRCRIDFGAEINLDLAPVLDLKPDQYRPPCIAGTIIYSSKHVEKLGWEERHSEARTGYIILFKPSLIEGSPADVRQYAIENKVFPQQTTADQWFDEAQFEAYRRLGQVSAQKAIQVICNSEGFTKKVGEANRASDDIASFFQAAVGTFGSHLPHAATQNHS